MNGRERERESPVLTGCRRKSMKIHWIVQHESKEECFKKKKDKEKALGCELSRRCNSRCLPTKKLSTSSSR